MSREQLAFSFDEPAAWRSAVERYGDLRGQLFLTAEAQEEMNGLEAWLTATWRAAPPISAEIRRQLCALFDVPEGPHQ